MIANNENGNSLNQATDRDPHNNNCYGTLVDQEYKLVSLPVLDVNSNSVLDVQDFNERIIRSYEDGLAEKKLPADLSVARSLIPAGTASLRDFSYIAPEIPEYIEDKCTGCMDCVTQCPDTAILGKVIAEPEWEEKMKAVPEDERERCSRKQWSRKTKKYYHGPQKKIGKEGGMFNIIIDPSEVQGMCRVCHGLR